MNIRQILTSAVLRVILHILCRIDADDLKKIPLEGPMIICINHINFLDAPLFQILLEPRKVRGFAKKETWDSPLLKYLFQTYNAIPVDRGTADLKAFREVAETLKAGHFICMAPEGTRSRTGILQEGKAGVVIMALMTGAPILPVVHCGTERFNENIKRLKRTRITLKAGEPVYLPAVKKTTPESRKKMIDDIMTRMAHLLPEELRGVYREQALLSKDSLDLQSETGTED